MGSAQSKHKITAQDKAILDMKVQRDKLKQFQKKVEVVLNREDSLARELLQKGDKSRALLALRRRKYQQQMINKTDMQLFNLQNLVEQIEFSLVQKDVLFGLEQGNKVLSQLNSEMRIEDVERLADNTAEAIAFQKEVSNILNANMSAEDDEAVLEDLAKLEREEIDKLQLDIPQAPQHAMPKHDVAEANRSNTLGNLEQNSEEEEEPRRNEPLLA
ncbi:charged multivesicular body protein 6 [Coemansia reversa NRRL 1564]|uniref:Charged multivesicular body protein 6 n=1 Tax=Coemansia reversa (strain ATCC 12441 / NRRL 1564) TaxID=763665 RepID=A0A2G5BKI0_COERN|nr:charged multivesicular body protein 6 [Coemansia reversa NRRL 1564]|eukprot:PIA19257.1 charged multivesicular body protein 6 [Coemansia reversa NRRL 1564]